MLVPFLGVAVSCKQEKTTIVETTEVVNSRRSYLTVQARNTLEEQAARGDTEAMMRLADYYLWSAGDLKTAYLYWKEAAALGNARAIENKERYDRTTLIPEEWRQAKLVSPGPGPNDSAQNAREK